MVGARKRGRTRTRLNRRQAAGAAAGVAATLLLYFVALPLLFAATYQGKADAALGDVTAKMDAVYGSFKQEVFTHSRSQDLSDEAEPAEVREAARADRDELAKSDKLIKEARQSFEEHESGLKGYVDLPLTGWWGPPREAHEAKRDAQAYVDRSREYLDEYAAVVEYSDAVNTIGERAELAVFTLSESDATDLGTLADDIDESADQVNGELTKLKALDPPAFLREEHERDVKNTDELVGIMHDLADGVRNLDLAQLESLTERLEQGAAEEEAESKAFYRELQNDSSLRKAIDELQRRQAELQERLGAI